jgi:hypothetical protein
MPNQCIKMRREITLLAKMYGSNPSFQGHIRRLNRLGGGGGQEPEREEEQMKAGSGRETWPWFLNRSSAPRSMALRSEPQILAPSSAPRSVAPTSESRSMAPRFQPRQRHLGCPAVHGQAPRRQDLWHRDVLPRSHDFWRRPPWSKDQFTSPRAPNVNFLQKKGQIVKNWVK